MSTPKPKYRILFSQNWSHHSNMEPHTIVIVPRLDTRGDFGFRTGVDLFIKCDEKNDLHICPAFLGFVADREETKATDTRVLEDIFRDRPTAPTVQPEELPAFFTMLPDMGEYRKMVFHLSPRRTADVLSALNDIIYANELTSRPAWLSPILDSSVFNLSFLRTAEAHFAYRNASSVLSGLEFETVGKMSQNWSIHFQLNGRPTPHDLRFHFAPSAELPKRIAVVIGENGMGKSQALARITRAAIEGDYKALRDGITYNRVMLNRLLAFAPTNEMKEVFPSDRRKRSQVWYRRFSLNRTPSRKSGSGLSDTILQLARSNEHILGEPRWDIFIAGIQAVNDWYQLALPDKNGWEPIALFNLRRFDEEEALQLYARVDISQNPVRLIDGQTFPLSSGEISFIRFAAQASLYVENGSMLLLDEPETHLHPRFISQFVSVLSKLLEKTNSLAIIATHSVYFVREVFEDQVIVLRNGPNREVLSEIPRLRTFGADVGAISYFVFRQDEPSNLAADVGLDVLSESQSWPEIFEKFKNELAPELLGLIREKLERPTEANGLE